MRMNFSPLQDILGQKQRPNYIDVSRDGSESTDSLMKHEEYQSEYLPYPQRPWLHFLVCLIIGLIPTSILWLSMPGSEDCHKGSSIHRTPIPESTYFQWRP